MICQIFQRRMILFSDFVESLAIEFSIDLNKALFPKIMGNSEKIIRIWKNLKIVLIEKKGIRVIRWKIIYCIHLLIKLWIKSYPKLIIFIQASVLRVFPCDSCLPGLYRCDVLNEWSYTLLRQWLRAELGPSRVRCVPEANGARIARTLFRHCARRARCKSYEPPILVCAILYVFLSPCRVDFFNLFSLLSIFIFLFCFSLARFSGFPVLIRHRCHPDTRGAHWGGSAQGKAGQNGPAE